MRRNMVFSVINIWKCSDLGKVVAGMLLECEESVNVKVLLFLV